MDITINHVKNVLNTLPIGYYLGRNIKVSLSEGPSSYFSPAQDLIVIGYASIEEMFNNVNTKYKLDLEETVRGLLYHELSHVLLTPDYLFDVCKTQSKNIHNLHDIINIFEDERIETLFAHNFMNTNFKKNIIILNNYNGEDPTSGMDAFYHTVRFHHGKDEFVQRVGKIIARYSKINASYGKTHSYGDYRSEYDEKNEISNYVDAIIGLYNDIVKDYENQNNDSNSNDSDSNDTNNNDNQTDDSTSDTSNNSDNSDTLDDNSSSNQNSDSSNADQLDGNESQSMEDIMKSLSDSAGDSQTSSTSNMSSDTADDNNDSVELSDEDVNDLVKDILTTLTDEDLASIFDHAVADTVYEYHDPKLTERLTRIIEMKLREKNKNGSAINSYSGRFNPRAVATRDDYKWWVQQNRNGHIRQFSKVHFNLIIDNSGSFRDNDTQMNMFIQALNAIKSKDFDFDVITYNTHAVEWPDTYNIFKSNGGTHLHNDINTILAHHQQPQANNYNIVLFDGDADPDRDATGTNAFKYFNSANTIIVTDPSNERYLFNTVSQARVIITNDYCEEFIDSVLNLLEVVM